MTGTTLTGARHPLFPELHPNIRLIQSTLHYLFVMTNELCSVTLTVPTIRKATHVNSNLNFCGNTNWPIQQPVQCTGTRASTTPGLPVCIQ